MLAPDGGAGTAGRVLPSGAPPRVKAPGIVYYPFSYVAISEMEKVATEVPLNSCVPVLSPLT